MEQTHAPLDSKLYPHQVKPEFRGEGKTGYFATPKLRLAVNLAIALGRPLLVRGEPGVGKTRLARAIADELTDGALLEWRIKSSDKVRDGLYHYDPIRRLIDTQLAEKSPEHREQALNPYHYIRFAYLGKAIISTKPIVLLIDEIDKADIDFPNDLLRELDELWFEVTEVPLRVGKIKPEQFAEWQRSLDEAHILKYARKKPSMASAFAIIHGGKKPRPIIIITSNDEKPLPPAFLRRCIVHTIEFPDLMAADEHIRQENRQLVENIIRENIKQKLNISELNERIIERVIEVFARIRSQRSLSKLPATAELVEWVMALHHPGMQAQLDALTGSQPLPYWEVMFKSETDQQIIAREFKDSLGSQP